VYFCVTEAEVRVKRSSTDGSVKSLMINVARRKKWLLSRSRSQDTTDVSSSEEYDISLWFCSQAQYFSTFSFSYCMIAIALAGGDFLVQAIWTVVIPPRTSKPSRRARNVVKLFS
jgi:hypothetical protein